MTGKITHLSKSATHTMSKQPAQSLQLLAGLGVAGDAHMGITVKHRSRVAQNPDQPNLRQVHLIHHELLDELCSKGFALVPGAMGENITTTGIPLLALPKRTQLHLGRDAVIELTGLRNPCAQLDGLQQGLMKAVLDKDEAGNLIRKAGVMSIVLQDGDIYPGDEIRVVLPPLPHTALTKV